MTDFERVGGADGLNRLIRDLLAREHKDMIIGFLFRDVDMERLLVHETAFAAAHLGGPRAYVGRPITTVHQPKRIQRGWFRRRIALLRCVLTDNSVPQDVIDRWVSTELALEPSVTDGTDCGPPAPEGS